MIHLGLYCLTVWWLTFCQLLITVLATFSSSLRRYPSIHYRASCFFFWFLVQFHSVLRQRLCGPLCQPTSSQVRLEVESTEVKSSRDWRHPFNTWTCFLWTTLVEETCNVLTRLRILANPWNLHDSVLTLLLFIIIIFWPGTQFPGNEKNTLCDTKKVQKLLLLLLLSSSPSLYRVGQKSKLLYCDRYFKD